MQQNVQRETVDGRMVRPMDKAPKVAQILPPDIRNGLVAAGQRRDVAIIDLLTDQAVRLGFARPRHDMSRDGEWLRSRGVLA